MKTNLKQDELALKKAKTKLKKGIGIGLFFIFIAIVFTAGAVKPSTKHQYDASVEDVHYINESLAHAYLNLYEDELNLAKEKILDATAREDHSEVNRLNEKIELLRDKIIAIEKGDYKIDFEVYIKESNDNVF